MSNQVSVVEFIRQAEPGTMVFELQSDGKGPYQVGFLIREEHQRVVQLRRNPLVEVRAGAFLQDDVWIVAVLFRVGEELYECWFNYHQPMGWKYFRSLAKQDAFTIEFYTPDLAKVVRVRNGLRHFFEEILSRITECAPWNMSAFDAARAKVYAEYPSVQALWDALWR